MSRKDQSAPLLDGKFLSKSELKNRLMRMDIELENKDQTKSHYCNLYNKLVNDQDRRMKIKSILETDIIDKPEKNLNRKRNRDGSEDTPDFKDQDTETKKGRSTNKGRRFKSKEEEADEEAEGEEEVNYEEIKQRNLPLGGFYEKIEKDLNENRNSFRGGVTGSNAGPINANMLSFSKDFGFDNKNVNNQGTFARPSSVDEAVAKGIIVDSNINLMNPNTVIKKLEYSEEIGGISDLNSPLVKNSDDVNKRFQGVQKVKIGNSSNFSNRSQNSQMNIRETNRFESEPNLNKQGSRKSLPGSTKNIKEILNKFASNTPANDFARVSRPRSNLTSTRSIVVSVRPTPVTDFNQPEGTIESTIPVFSSISKVYNYKDYSLLLMSAVLAGFTVYLVYLFYKNEGYVSVYNFLQDLDKSFPDLKYLLSGMLFSVISIILYKKFSNTQFFQQLASEDYENIKELIKNNYQTEDNPLGLFETNFVRDFAKKHNMSEGKYRKNVMPHLTKIRIAKREIEAKELLIQEQGQIVWDFIDNNYIA